MSPPEPWSPDEWHDEGPVRHVAGAAAARAATSAGAVVGANASTGATRRGGSARASFSTRRGAGDGTRQTYSRRPKLPPDVVGELVKAVGARRAPKLVEYVDAARRAFEGDRYTEARRLIAPVAKEAPGAAAVRELHGLTLYRLERYKAAAVELDAYATLTGEVDEHPVLADCHRAMKHWSRVEELWTELREVSPSAELVTEGRIVASGALADRGQLEAGIALLEKSPRPKGKVRTHHLREWYALADLADRAGDAPRARRIFERIAEHDGAFADVPDRLRALGT